MNFRSHIPKPQKLILLLIFIMTLFVIIITPRSVYAAEGNGTDNDSGHATGNYAGGPSYTRTGWLMYLVTNDDDEVVSDVVFMSCNSTPQGAVKWKTRIGDMNPARPISGSVPWASAVGSNGAPFDNNQSSNGAKIKNWMLEDDGLGTENWFNVVESIWGSEKAIAMAKNGYSLIMEPVYWANIGSGWFCGNAKGWGQYLSAKYGRESYGPSTFRKFTNGIFAHCAKFAYDKWSLIHYEGGSRLLNWEMEYYAVGIMSITPKNSAIHTYNGVDSPGPPEPRLPGKTGTCNIVKGYYKENLTTGAKESLGVYSELDVTSNIIVSSEPDFELIEYLCL